MAEGAAAPGTSSPSPPLAQTGASKNLQCSRVTKSSWGFFVQCWPLCLETDEPHTSARDQRPAQSAGFWAGYGRWGWQVQLWGRGSLTKQGQFKSSEVQKLALV